MIYGCKSGNLEDVIPDQKNNLGNKIKLITTAKPQLMTHHGVHNALEYLILRNKELLYVFCFRV